MILARKLNQAFGGAFFLPWEVDELASDYEPYIEAALGIVNDLPGMMEARRKIETKMEAIRQRHSKSIKH